VGFRYGTAEDMCRGDKLRSRSVKSGICMLLFAIDLFVLGRVRAVIVAMDG
jgi:hypothetical protein